MNPSDLTPDDAMHFFLFIGALLIAWTIRDEWKSRKRRRKPIRAFAVVLETEPDESPFDDGISGYDHDPFTAADKAEFEQRAELYRRIHDPKWFESLLPVELR